MKGILNLKGVNFTLCKLYLHKPDLQKNLLSVVHYETLCPLKLNTITVPRLSCNPNGILEDILQLYYNLTNIKVFKERTLSVTYQKQRHVMLLFSYNLPTCKLTFSFTE